MGQGRGFATLDSISDPLLLTKYNALLHRAQLLQESEVSQEVCAFENVRSCVVLTCVFPFQCYAEAVEFCYAAVKQLSSPAIPSKVRLQLDLPLHELILILELKGAEEKLRRSEIPEG